MRRMTSRVPFLYTPDWERRHAPELAGADGWNRHA
jgi:hypothetical protein